MSRYSTWRYSLVVLLSGLLGVTSVQAEPVKLAVLLPLSNIYKTMGVKAKQGFLLGIQQEAAAHHVDWKSWITLEVVDTRSDQDHTVQLAQDAVASGAQAILGCTASDIGLALQDYVLNEVGVPFIVFAGCVTEKLRTPHPLFIRTSMSSQLRPTVMARWIKTHPIVAGDKPRWVCIHKDDSSGVGECDAFKRTYGQVGEEIGRVPSLLKTVNKKQQIVQLVKLKPDFALAVFTGAEAEVFFKDYLRYKVHQKIPLVGLLGGMSYKRMGGIVNQTLAKQGVAVDLMVAPILYSERFRRLANQHFVAQYRQTYNARPSTHSMWGYDAGRLLMKALIELEGKWDGAKVVQLMKTVPYTSPRHGEPLQFDTHGDAMSPAYALKIKWDGNALVFDVLGQVPPVNMDEVLK